MKHRDGSLYFTNIFHINRKKQGVLLHPQKPFIDEMIDDFRHFLRGFIHSMKEPVFDHMNTATDDKRAHMF